jgi:hypothetical protein
MRGYDSALFPAHVVMGYQTIDGKKRYFPCTSINAKNGYGGYTGQEGFLIAARADRLHAVFLDGTAANDRAFSALRMKVRMLKTSPTILVRPCAHNKKDSDSQNV